MRRRRREGFGFAPRIYIDFYTDVVRLLTDGGYEFPRMGGLLPQSIVELMNAPAERGENPADFAAWLLREQRSTRPVVVDERDNIGEETIALSEVA